MYFELILKNNQNRWLIFIYIYFFKKIDLSIKIFIQKFKKNLQEFFLELKYKIFLLLPFNRNIKKI